MIVFGLIKYHFINACRLIEYRSPVVPEVDCICYYVATGLFFINYEL